MALVAHSHLQPEQLPRSRYYAPPSQIQHQQPPFLYTGPKLQTSNGSRKVKKVPGLVAQFERRGSPEEPQNGLIKAQRTLGLVTELPRDRRSWRKSSSEEYTGTLAQKLAQAERDVRRLSRQPGDTEQYRDEVGATVDHELSDGEEYESNFEPDEADDADPEKTILLGVSLQDSPKQLSFPKAPIELDAGPDHELLMPPPRPRIRPHSYTAPRFRERPMNKIASSRSRGLRANSTPPNFSRPLSGFSQTPIPGEDMERDPLFLRFREIELDPRSPISPIGGTSVSDEIKAARERVELEKSRLRAISPMPPSPQPPPSPWAPIQRNKKTRWSSLPVSLIKFAARKRSSKTEEENIQLYRQPTKEAATLTEENLQRWEDEVGYVPKMYRLGYDLLKNPIDVDMEVERSTPIPPISPIPSPPISGILTPPASPPLVEQSPSDASTIRAFGSPSVSIATFHEHSSSPSVAIRSSTTSTLIRRFPFVPQPEPSQPTLAAQKEALAHKPIDMLTCAICKEVEHIHAFPPQPLTETCLHAARTCKECVQHWIETCVNTKGWDKCTCPECGAGMSWDDVRTLVPEHKFKRLDELATRSSLSQISDFYWCQRTDCPSGQLHPSPAADPTFVCVACGYTYCLNHPTVPFHERLSCAEYDAQSHSRSPSLREREASEKEGQRTVQEVSQRCPNAICGWWIQKSDGCDHMKCAKCGYEFCWECGANYKAIFAKGGKAHRKTCKLWGNYGW